jgi:hypothetical protein
VIGLDFLGPWLLLAKNPDCGGLICLDFLGFSRPNRDFSMGYAAKARKIFSRALSFVPGWETPGRERAVEAMRKGRIAHEASLA